MEKKDWLTKNFEDSRKHLKAVAYQMLGSSSEAEDAVQEAWINGIAGGTWAPGGKPVVAFCFKVVGGRIAEIEIVMDKDKLEKSEIKIILCFAGCTSPPETPQT